MSAHPVDVLTQHFPDLEVNAWQLRPGVVLEISERWPIRAWRYVYARHDDDGGVSLQNVTPGSPAVSVDAGHGVDNGLNDCRTNTARGLNPQIRPLGAAPCAIGRCGYRVVRDWTSAFAVFRSVHTVMVAHGQIEDVPPLFMARVRAWGRVAAADFTDPLDTIRVQRYAVDALLHDESTSQYQPALRACYPSVATYLSDRPMADLAAEKGGGEYDMTIGGGLARMISRRLTLGGRS